MAGGGGEEEQGDSSPSQSGPARERDPGSPPLREQERLLPIANVGRIMKKALPGNAKISKDAKETVQECASELISFITGEASDKCQRERRKTINGDDVLWAMTTLGFEDYLDPLKMYLQRYRELEGERLPAAKPGDSLTVQEVASFTGASSNGNPSGGFYQPYVHAVSDGGYVQSQVYAPQHPSMNAYQFSMHGTGGSVSGQIP